MDEYKTKKILLMVKLVLIIFLSAWLLIFILHKTMTHFEIKKMQKAGVYNPVSTGEYDLNVYLYGNENGNHTIVGISGMGVNTYSMTLKGVTDRFSHDNRIAIPDRAGYGMSDSTTKPQTIEQVVEDYRTVLKRAGCKAPYILLPHSLGGMFATYWESKYPDEIEGILILDGSILGTEGYTLTHPRNAFGELKITALCNTGLQRLFHDSMKGEMAWQNLTIRQKEYAQAMEMHSTFTYAMLSESKLVDENSRKAWESIVTNDIPKIYVTTMMEFPEDVKDYLVYKNESYKSIGKEPPYDVNDEAAIKNYIDENADRNMVQLHNIDAYTKQLGNCEIKFVPGTHNIYKQKPDQIAELLSELIGKIEDKKK